jgi:tryptophan synthase beta subunit
MPRDAVLLVNLSGRGDKDVMSVKKVLDAERSPA